MRHDLAALPWVLATAADVVVAPPPRPAFLTALHAAGVRDLCAFQPNAPSGRCIAGERPYGVVGEHLRRSSVARYREDVSVCRSLVAVREAVALRGRPKAVLKAEFSSSGLGVRVCEGVEAIAGSSELERWAGNCLRRDGTVTVEPFYDILAEFTGEWRDGAWCGVSMPLVESMQWVGQWLGDPRERYDDEMVAFVFEQRALEKALAALDVPGTCGTTTCGMDVAVVRNEDGALGVRVLELNARTTMSHYALAAKRRVPNAVRFDVLRVSEAASRSDLVCLTDPETATMFVAVLEVRRPCDGART